MIPNLPSVKQFNDYITCHPIWKPSPMTVIDQLETVGDLNAWLSKADKELTKLRRELIALNKSNFNTTSKLLLDIKIGVLTDKRHRFIETLALWKQAHQKLSMLERRTWADLEGEDGPNPDESDSQPEEIQGA